MQVPVAAVLNANTKRDTGKKAQHGNIAAAKVRVFLSTLHDDQLVFTAKG